MEFLTELNADEVQTFGHTAGESAVRVAISSAGAESLAPCSSLRTSEPRAEQRPGWFVK